MRRRICNAWRGLPDRPALYHCHAESCLDAATRLAGWEHASPVTIGDNVWFGANVTVTPGVTIGSNSIIGAGSVVTRDIPANSIAVGNPAHVIREIPERDPAFADVEGIV